LANKNTKGTTSEKPDIRAFQKLMYTKCDGSNAFDNAILHGMGYASTESAFYSREGLGRCPLF
jgi:hypothetical protein